MTNKQAKESVGQPCHVLCCMDEEIGEGVQLSMTFNGTIKEFHEESEEVTISFPDGSHSMPQCILTVHLGHTPEPNNEFLISPHDDLVKS